MYRDGWLCPTEYVQYYLKYIVKSKTSQLSSLFVSHETIKLYHGVKEIKLWHMKLVAFTIHSTTCFKAIVLTVKEGL